MPATPQYIDVSGSSAVDIPIDATGTQYDGEYRTFWVFGTPAPYDRAVLEFGGQFSETDADIDVVLRNYTDGSNVASLTNVTDEPDRATVEFDPTDIDPGDLIGLRVNVNTASSTGGATLDATLKLILRP